MFLFHRNKEIEIFRRICTRLNGRQSHKNLLKLCLLLGTSVLAPELLIENTPKIFELLIKWGGLSDPKNSECVKQLVATITDGFQQSLLCCQDKFIKEEKAGLTRLSKKIEFVPAINLVGNMLSIAQRDQFWEGRWSRFFGNLGFGYVFSDQVEKLCGMFSVRFRYSVRPSC